MTNRVFSDILLNQIMTRPDVYRNGQEDAIDRAIVAAFRANPGSCLAFNNAMDALGDLTGQEGIRVLHQRYAPVHSPSCLMIAPQAVPSEA